MNLILRQIIGYQQGRRATPISSDPLLKSQLDQANKDLNSILKKWKFGEEPITSASQFLNQFEPWVKSQLEKQKSLKEFLAKKGVTSLAEADTKLTNRELGEGEELEQLRKELKETHQKHQQELQTKVQEFQASNGELLARIAELENRPGESEELKTLRKELAELKETWKNTEEDYLARIEELLRTKSTGETPEDYEELITEKDQLQRDKGELQQEVLSLNNKLKLKQQEVSNKEKSLETLKKEKDQQEVSLNKKITEKNGLITTLQREVNQLKDKYSKQGKLLDE